MATFVEIAREKFKRYRGRPLLRVQAAQYAVLLKRRLQDSSEEVTSRNAPTWKWKLMEYVAVPAKICIRPCRSLMLMVL